MWHQQFQLAVLVTVGAMLLPMSVVAVTAATLSGRTTGVWARLVTTAIALTAGSVLLFFVDGGT